MDKNCLNKLEYNKILELLKNQCTTYLGKELALDLLPSNKTSRVSKLLSETDEASKLILRKGILPLTDFENIDIYLKNLASSYSLTSRGLLDIGRILKTLHAKSNFWKNVKYSLIGFFFSGITPAASGGQPMQVYYMHKDKIPAAHATLTLLINFKTPFGVAAIVPFFAPFCNNPIL